MELEKKQKKFAKLEKLILKLEKKNSVSKKNIRLYEISSSLRNGDKGAYTFLLSLLAFFAGAFLLVPCILGAFPLGLLGLSIPLMVGGTVFAVGPTAYIKAVDTAPAKRTKKLNNLKNKANHLSWELQDMLNKSNTLENEDIAPVVEENVVKPEPVQEESTAKYTTKKSLGKSKEITDEGKDL